MKSGETLYSSLEAEGFDGDDSLVESILMEESAFDVIERERADAFFEAIVGEPVDFRGRSVEQCMELIEKIPMVGTSELSDFELMGPEQVVDGVWKSGEG